MNIYAVFWRIWFFSISINIVNCGITRVKGEDVWQLCNECSQNCLAINYGSKRVHARGKMGDGDCTTDFNVLSVDFGIIRLQHSLTKRYICMNANQRITTKVNGAGDSCAFIEHLDEAYHTRLESVRYPGVFMAFNKKGRFLSRATSRADQARCVQFNKFQRRVSDSEHRSCCRREQRCNRVDRDVGAEPPKKDEDGVDMRIGVDADVQEHLTKITEQMILDSVRASSNDLLNDWTTTTPPPAFDDTFFLDHYFTQRRRSEFYHDVINKNNDVINVDPSRMDPFTDRISARAQRSRKRAIPR